MKRGLTKNFSENVPAQPAGLFDRIILAIKREQELRRTKKLLFLFLFLLAVSTVSTPLSGYLLVNQVKMSGVSYFISAAFLNIGTFLLYWKDFSLAIVEALPLVGIVVFAASLAVSIFTLRLFLYRKSQLLKYLMHNFTYGAN